MGQCVSAGSKIAGGTETEAQRSRRNTYETKSSNDDVTYEDLDDKKNKKQDPDNPDAMYTNMADLNDEDSDADLEPEERLAKKRRRST